MHTSCASLLDSKDHKEFSLERKPIRNSLFRMILKCQLNLLPVGDHLSLTCRNEPADSKSAGCASSFVGVRDHHVVQVDYWLFRELRRTSKMTRRRDPFHLTDVQPSPVECQVGDVVQLEWNAQFSSEVFGWDQVAVGITN